MKTIFWMFIHLFFISIVALSQTVPVQVLSYSQGNINGYISQIDSSRIVLSKGWSKRKLKEGKLDKVVISIEDIKMIKLKGNIQALAGSMAGTGIGLVFGSTRNLRLRENYNPGTFSLNGPIDASEHDVKLGFNLAIVGSVVGAIIGSFARRTIKRYKIDGQINLFNLYRPDFQLIVF